MSSPTIHGIIGYTITPFSADFVPLGVAQVSAFTCAA